MSRGYQLLRDVLKLLAPGPSTRCVSSSPAPSFACSVAKIRKAPDPSCVKIKPAARLFRKMRNQRPGGSPDPTCLLKIPRIKTVSSEALPAYPGFHRHKTGGCDRSPWSAQHAPGPSPSQASGASLGRRGGTALHRPVAENQLLAAQFRAGGPARQSPLSSLKDGSNRDSLGAANNSAGYKPSSAAGSAINRAKLHNPARY